MALADLVLALRSDIGDPNRELLDDPSLERCIEKAASRLGRDLDRAFSIEGGVVVPEPVGETRELLLLLAFIHVCRVMRARTANAFSFSSGDKRVDKTQQPEHWAKLEADLEAAYRRLLGQVRPDAGAVDDDSIVRPVGLGVIPYEQGRELEP